MGLVYKRALDFEKAGALFMTVLDRDRELAGQAAAELPLIRKIRRAAPGTEIAKKIVLKEKIDRADCATLFDQEMNIEKLFIERGVKTADAECKSPTEASMAKRTDKVITLETGTVSAGHWLKPSIDTVSKLHLRGLEEGPDHTFDPGKLITRAEFALMLEDILVRASGDEKLATRFLGTTSPFADVGNDRDFFNAAMNSTSMGFIEADKATGEFEPGSPVSGVDALLSIRELENRLKF